MLKLSQEKKLLRLSYTAVENGHDVPQYTGRTHLLNVDQY